MSPKSRTQAPIVRPLPRLSDRTLRFANAWHTVALLADQAAQVRALYPNAITADKYEQAYLDALKGVEALHKEYWGLSSLRETEEALQAAKEDESNWLVRNHVRAASE